MAIKEEKERNRKEGAERQEEAVMKEVEGSREEGRRRKAMVARIAIVGGGGERKRIQRRRTLSSDGSRGVEIAREKEGGAKAELKVWRGGKKKLEEWRSKEGAGNREENEERGEERVRGTVMAKGGQREGGVCLCCEKRRA